MKLSEGDKEQIELAKKELRECMDTLLKGLDTMIDTLGPGSLLFERALKGIAFANSLVEAQKIAKSALDEVNKLLDD